MEAGCPVLCSVRTRVASCREAVTQVRWPSQGELRRGAVSHRVLTPSSCQQGPPTIPNSFPPRAWTKGGSHANHTTASPASPRAAPRADGDLVVTTTSRSWSGWRVEMEVRWSCACLNSFPTCGCVLERAFRWKSRVPTETFSRKLLRVCEGVLSACVCPRHVTYLPSFRHQVMNIYSVEVNGAEASDRRLESWGKGNLP